MSARLVLTTQAEDLVGAFTAELTEAGASRWPSTIGGARAFCARYPVPATFPPSRSTSSTKAECPIAVVPCSGSAATW